MPPRACSMRSGFPPGAAPCAPSMRRRVENGMILIILLITLQPQYCYLSDGPSTMIGTSGSLLVDAASGKMEDFTGTFTPLTTLHATLCTAPKHMALDTSNGDIYVTCNHQVVKRTAAGVVSVFAGTTAASSAGTIGQPISTVRFSSPDGIAIDVERRYLFICDKNNDRFVILNLANDRIRGLITHTADMHANPGSGAAYSPFTKRFYAGILHVTCLYIVDPVTSSLDSDIPCTQDNAPNMGPVTVAASYPYGEVISVTTHQGCLRSLALNNAADPKSWTQSFPWGTSTSCGSGNDVFGNHGGEVASIPYNSDTLLARKGNALYLLKPFATPQVIRSVLSASGIEGMLVLPDTGKVLWTQGNSLMSYCCFTFNFTNTATQSPTASLAATPTEKFIRYKYFSNPRILQVTAARNCDNDGGWLASIPDAAAMQLAFDALKGVTVDGSNEVVTGGHLDYTRQLWFWKYGPLKNQYFAQGGVATCPSFNGRYCSWRENNGQSDETITTIRSKTPDYWNDNGDGDSDVAGYLCEYGYSQTKVPTGTNTYTWTKTAIPTLTRSPTITSTLSLSLSTSPSASTSVSDSYPTKSQSYSMSFSATASVPSTPTTTSSASYTESPTLSATDSGHSGSSSPRSSFSSSGPSLSRSLSLTYPTLSSIATQSRLSSSFSSTGTDSPSGRSLSATGTYSFSLSSSQSESPLSLSASVSFSKSINFAWIEVVSTDREDPIVPVPSLRSPTLGGNATSTPKLTLLVRQEQIDIVGARQLKARQTVPSAGNAANGVAYRQFLLQAQSTPVAEDVTHCFFFNSSEPAAAEYLQGNVTARFLNNSAAELEFRWVPANTSQLFDLEGEFEAWLVMYPECLSKRRQLSKTNFTFYSPPKPRAGTIVSPQVVKATKDATAAVSVISMSVGGGAVATQVARSTLVLTLVNCTPDFFTRLGPMQNPFQVSIGPEKYGAYVASAMLNHSIILGLGILQLLWAWFEMKRQGITFAEARIYVRFPSIAVLPLMFFIEPTCMSAVVTIIYGDGAAFKFAGCVSLLICIGIVVGVFVHMRRTWAAEMIPGESPLDMKARKRSAVGDDDDGRDLQEAAWRHRGRQFVAWLGYFVDGGVKWKDKPGHKGFCRSHRIIFMDYTGKWYWFASLEIAIAGLCGILDGIKLGLHKCDGIIIALIVILFIFFVAVIALRPYNAPFLLLFSILVSGIQLAAAVCMGISMFGGGDDWQEFAETLTLVGIYLIIGRAFFDIFPKVKQLVGSIVKKCFKRPEPDKTHQDLTQQLLQVVAVTGVEEELHNVETRSKRDSILDTELPEQDPSEWPEYEWDESLLPPLPVADAPVEEEPLSFLATAERPSDFRDDDGAPTLENDFMRRVRQRREADEAAARAESEKKTKKSTDMEELDRILAELDDGTAPVQKGKAVAVPDDETEPDAAAALEKKMTFVKQLGRVQSSAATLSMLNGTKSKTSPTAAQPVVVPAVAPALDSELSDFLDALEAHDGQSLDDIEQEMSLSIHSEEEDEEANVSKGDDVIGQARKQIRGSAGELQDEDHVGTEQQSLLL